MNQTEKISKEAGIQRAYLKSGKIDINQLDAFLARVELMASPGTGKINTRIARQMISFKDKRLTA